MTFSKRICHAPIARGAPSPSATLGSGKSFIGNRVAGKQVPRSESIAPIHAALGGSRALSPNVGACVSKYLLTYSEAGERYARPARRNCIRLLISGVPCEIRIGTRRTGVAQNVQDSLFMEVTDEIP